MTAENNMPVSVVPIGMAFRDGKPDEETIKNIVTGVGNHVDAIFFGSTGYFQIIDLEQVLIVADIVRTITDKSIYACITGGTTASAIASGEKIAEHDSIDGLVLTAPGYIRGEEFQPEVDDHFYDLGRHFSEQSKPVLAYIIPGRSKGQSPSNEILEIMVMEGLLNGLKDSRGDLDAFNWLRDLQILDKSFALYLGAEVLERQAFSPIDEESGTARGVVHTALNFVPGIGRIAQGVVLGGNSVGDYELELAILKCVQKSVYGYTTEGKRRVTEGATLGMFFTGMYPQGVTIPMSALGAGEVTKDHFETAQRFVVRVAEIEHISGTPILPKYTDRDAIGHLTYESFTELLS
tara:strand:- start:3103 stop:4152 length:1050 start_codon:yes stop_codon:yes gene_type:complete